jgi:hypothetical protein
MTTTQTNETKWKQAGLAIYAADKWDNGRNHGGQFIAQLTSEECREAEVCGAGFEAVALFDYETQFANARLIAAAPELLSDLEDLVLSCAEALPYAHPALVNARASIARAKGGV